MTNCKWLYYVRLLLCGGIILYGLSVSAASSTIPPELEPWRDWVLLGYEDHFCPSDYNHKTKFRCAWSTELVLKIEAHQGQFEQTWLMFKAGWIPLPGEPGIWPQSVLLNQASVPVILRDNAPHIYVPTGEHKISGNFQWEMMPETLFIPPSSGMIKLWIDQTPVPHPLLESNGRLWLQKRTVPVTEEDRQEVRIFRLIEDGIPLQIITQVRLTISGQAREIRLPQIMLPDSIPLRIESRLPARLNHEGELMIQAMPGKWVVRLAAYLPEPVYSLGPAKCQYGQEIWAFSAMSRFRVVEIQGVAGVEPSRTELPAEWQGHPAYIIQADDILQMKEIKRGDPDPAPDRLTLNRTFWLDFDGSGLTIRDQITGSMSSNWRLSMNQPGLLGRVMVDDQDCLITYSPQDGKPGVELRRGQIRLTADSRLEQKPAVIPAAGWDHDFQSLSATLHLPPGWRLLTAAGVDILPGTWFQRWTLLDLFLVLMISLAIYKLRGFIWGVAAIAAMTLIYHEPDAPNIVFLHIIITLGLVKVLPQGWIRTLVKIWGTAAMICLLAISIPFMVQQLNHGLYPQLESTGQFRSSPPLRQILNNMPLGVQLEQYSAAPTKRYSEDRVPAAAPKQQKLLYAYQPEALIQTGPGLPNWTWRSVSMKWNGPVDRHHEIRLWLMSPAVNLMIAFLRVALLAWLIVGLLKHNGFIPRLTKLIDDSPAPKGQTNTAAGIMIVLSLLFIGTPADASAQPYPPPEILQQLRERLLEPHPCLPYCADVEKLELELIRDRLKIRLIIHAAQETAVPLPVSADSWMPADILVNNLPVKALFRDHQGMLWALIPQGIHHVLLDGTITSGDSIRIPVPIKPHYATAIAEGWEITGISRKGRIESGIQLIPGKQGTETSTAYSASAIPPFFHIKRIIRLGITWQVETTIQRLTANTYPVALAVPLLPGESLADTTVVMENNRALVNLDAGINQAAYISIIQPVTNIQLKAPDAVPWTETWILDISPIWSIEYSGIPVIHHQDYEGVWRPEWRPWPGEILDIQISKPLSVPGQVFTIDSAQLKWTPGKRINKAQLRLTVRTSRGGNHGLTIPAQAIPQTLKINDLIEPIRQEGQQIILSLQPRTSTVLLEWNEPASFSFMLKAPEINLGEAAVNSQVIFEMPRQLWILWVNGPTLGPAVLFWSYLLIAVLAAAGLGKISITPLKFRHWLLLNLGLTQIHPIAAIIVISWFFMLAWRKTKADHDRGFWTFNFIQLMLAGLTVAAGFGLYFAIENGLLGIPYMQISGNGSHNTLLAWTMDRIDGNMPTPWALVVPIFIYRLLMLLWALWLALSLLKWAPWGWECYGAGGFWKRWTKKSPPPLSA